MDIISRLFEHLENWIAGWQPSSLQFLLRLILLFLLPCTLCGVAFRRGSRSVFAQTLCAVCGVLLACTLPVQKWVFDNITLKTWMVVISVVVLAFLPAILPSLLAPTVGVQRRLQAVLYGALVALLLGNLCFR